MSKRLPKELAFFLASLLSFSLIFYFLLPQAQHPHTQSRLKAQKTSRLSYLALGDSLTQGVGDATDQGGFVPLLAQKLQAAYSYQVDTRNFGVSGNTSSQILKRMTSNKQLSSSLKQADLMTLTVGGNDVMAVIRKNLSDLKVSSFTHPARAYQKRLGQIIELARQDNPDLPIYVVGIYNPFYLNFPELTAMQDIVDNWNQSTEAVCQKYDKVYFVSINDLLYKGVDGQQAINTSDDDSQVINDALFDGDHFHPNNTGYQIISTAVMEKISETQKNWKN